MDAPCTECGRINYHLFSCPKRISWQLTLQNLFARAATYISNSKPYDRGAFFLHNYLGWYSWTGESIQKMVKLIKAKDPQLFQLICAAEKAHSELDQYIVTRCSDLFKNQSK